MAYGIERLQSAVVPNGAANCSGAELSVAGVFPRRPLENPKPAVAAVATMTSMLCGADPVGGVDTGSLTTYCMAFQRAKDKAKIFALWRVNGKCDVNLTVSGTATTITDAMGNKTAMPVKNSVITVSLGPTPVWLTGVDGIDGFDFGAPVYDSAPARITRPLADMTEARWTYEGSEDKAYVN